ncbi:hypothetical protein F6P96_00830 [Escherichia coli]|nr:hypothetical protein F6P96_00830 [Escherichia coli]
MIRNTFHLLVKTFDVIAILFHGENEPVWCNIAGDPLLYGCAAERHFHTRMVSVICCRHFRWMLLDYCAGPAAGFSCFKTGKIFIYRVRILLAEFGKSADRSARSGTLESNLILTWKICGLASVKVGGGL